MCRLCEHRHWSYQGCVFGRSGIRSVRVERVLAELPPPREDRVTKAAVKPGGCEVCGKPLPKSLGKRPRTTCSPKCRTAKSRRK